MRHQAPAILLLLLLGGSVRADERPPSNVEVSDVVAKKVSAGRTFVGDVAPSRRTVVSTEFGGLVVEYLVEEGDAVELGQVIARLDTHMVKERLAAARAELRYREALVTELKNGSRAEDVAEARARELRQKSERDSLTWKRIAAESLYERKRISEDELREARVAEEAATALYDALTAIRERVEAGPRAEEIAQAEAQVEVQAAEVSRLEEEERRYVLSAPFAGYVVRELAEEGQWLSAGDEVADIACLDPVEVVVPVGEDFIAGVRMGMEVQVSVEAIPGQVFVGTVYRIVPIAGRAARSFPVRVRLPNVPNGPSVLLKAGMLARVTLSVGEERDAVLVPKDAIVLGGAGRLVYALDKETNTARMVPVQLGIADQGLIQVMGDLDVGDQVIVRGNERLMPGAPVHVIGTR